MSRFAVASEDVEASEENRLLAADITAARDAIFDAIVAAVKPEKRGDYFIFTPRQLTVLANALGRTIGKILASLSEDAAISFLNVEDESANLEVERRRAEGAGATIQ